MNRIKEVLDAKGISQTELANRLGKTFNMVNLYATNKVQPPIPVLYQSLPDTLPAGSSRHFPRPSLLFYLGS